MHPLQNAINNCFKALKRKVSAKAFSPSSLHSKFWIRTSAHNFAPPLFQKTEVSKLEPTQIVSKNLIYLIHRFSKEEDGAKLRCILVPVYGQILTVEEIVNVSSEYYNLTTGH